MLANFLYINGIKYEYEAPYKHKTSDNTYRQYRPDFYLPDYDIYIEHFGIDRKGETHFSNNKEQNVQQTNRYRTEMEWKRDLHKRHKTILIETFSYEFNEGSWETLLMEKLKAHKVRFELRPIEEILSDLRSNGTVKQVVELFATFLDLTKSNGYTLDTLREKIIARRNPREKAFFEVFAPIHKAYEDHLTQTHSIDFHDMLIKAAKAIESSRFVANYKYIVIDEFQDVL